MAPKRKALQVPQSPLAHVPLTAFQIVEAVGQRFSLTAETLFGRARPRSVSRARHIAMLLLRSRLGASNAEIGRWFNRDASTVLSGIRAVGEQAEPNTYHDIQAIRAALDNRATLVAVHIATWPDGRYLAMGNSTQSNQRIVENLKALANKLDEGPYTLSERIVEVPCA